MSSNSNTSPLNFDLHSSLYLASGVLIFEGYFRQQHLLLWSDTKWMQSQTGGDGWGSFVLTLLLVEAAAVQLLYISAYLRKLQHMLRRHCRPVKSAINMLSSIYLRLYSSLSLFTLARTLYRALISGVMVSIWTPTPSGCTQDTPGLVTRSAPEPNLRVWL